LELISKKEEIRAANKLDLEKAKIEVEQGNLSSSLYKRLDLFGADDEKFQSLLSGLTDVIKLEDPVGKVTLSRQLDEGLELYRVSCPVGVLCIMFEARPEVNIQVSSLALKSGNAVILKGGSEALHSNAILANIFREALRKTEGISDDVIQFVSSRDAVEVLLDLDKYIDLVIPRGSADLVRYIKGRTRIPVLGHADGICSVYLDKEADLQKAISVTVDAKTTYVAACNSAEKLIVHRDVLESVFKPVAIALMQAGVKLRAEQEALDRLPSGSNAVLATSEDFSTEFLSLEMSVKVVASIDEAITHINQYGSHHTDSIVTENRSNAELFMSLVDSAGVYHNASTRFADGFRYGFGAEIGVSTSKTHARGPVGLEGLVIYKYRIYGDGHRVQDYGTGAGKRPFTHVDISSDRITKLS